MKGYTVVVIALTIIGLVAWDVYAILYGGDESSISSVIITYSYDYPLIPFLSGVLCGHFFWRLKSNLDTKQIDKRTNDEQ
jgi:hypothetical protein